MKPSLVPEAGTSCPSGEDLAALVEGTLSEGTQETLMTHLGDCPACQAHLDRLATCSDGWPLWERLLADSHPPLQTCLIRKRTPAEVTSVAPTPADDFPTIPGYPIVTELGRGGMGIVYLARDTSLNRVVALKVLLPQFACQEEYRQRFQTEAQAAARLDHPNIVRIHAVGEHSRHPYLVLEYVEGITLKQALEGEAWPLAAAVRLVAILAQAIHVAHQAGIIHRDLKPGNILLSGDGTASAAVPRITDFGLAKDLDAVEDHTRTGIVAGTPGYMAPEQASGEPGQVGPATDVFALGAILYELLTGRPPVKAHGRLEAIRQTLEETAVSPRRLNPQVSRDLETVCLKAIEKSPGQRYASAMELADDLTRYLKGVPVRARPQPLWRQVWKWGRRNPLRSTLAAGTGLVVAALLGMWLVFTAQLHEERTRTEQRRQEAMQNYRLALQAVNNLVEVGEDPEFEAQGLEPLQKKMLEKARGFFMAFTENEAEDPEVLASQANALVRLGQIDTRLDIGPGAIASLEHAIGIYRRLVEREPEVRAHTQGLGLALRSLGNTCQLLGQIDKARPALREAISLFADLSREDPDHPEHRFDLAYSHFYLGWCELRDRNLDLAPKHYQEAITLLRQQIARTPENPNLHGVLGTALHQLGHIALKKKRHGEGLASMEAGLRNRSEALRLSPQSPRYQSSVCISHIGIGRALRLLGRTGEAEQAFQLAIEIADRLLREHPSVIRYTEFLAGGYSGLGLVLTTNKEWSGAEAWFRKALAYREPLARTHPHVKDYVADYFECLDRLRFVCIRQGKDAEVEELYLRTEEGYAWFIPRVADPTPLQLDRATRLTRFAQRLADRGQRERALEYSAQAATIMEENWHTANGRDFSVMVAYAALRAWRARQLEEAGRPTEAEQEYARLAEMTPAR